MTINHAVPLLAALLGSAAVPAAAQGPSRAPAPPPSQTEASYFSRADLQAIENRVAENPATRRPGGFSKRLFTMPNYSDSFIRIAEPDKPHAHGRWSEVYIITAGAAVLETGGTITGAVEGNSATHSNMFLDHKPAAATSAPRAPADPNAPKDLAGVDIVGGHRQAVGPGDVILIPAGVAHRWASVGTPVVYHDVKFPR